MSVQTLKDGRSAVPAGGIRGTRGRAVGGYRLWSCAGDDYRWRTATITLARQTAHRCCAASASRRTVAIDVEVSSRCLYR